MIDLHLHTTASDGSLSPEELVREAARVGITTLAVTDHDTTAGVAAATTAARAAGLVCIPGIEITAVQERRDIHVLAYFFDATNEELAAFLQRQRENRRRRLFEMAAELERLGAPVDLDPLNDTMAVQADRAPGRPLLAAALVEAGHVSSIGDAFERFLAHGRPAFVPRRGASPADVIALIARVGGVSSLAHPGKLDIDDTIPDLVDAGLSAIEVHHSDHTDDDVERYQEIATKFDLLVTGGSDYHGPESGRTTRFGLVALPAAEYARLVEHAGWAADRVL